MTTPASGTISLYNVNAEIGNGTNSISLSWVKANTKDAVSALGSIYNRAWYQKNNVGNCNNGNCWNCYSNCGDKQCNCACNGGTSGGNNCYNINCTNCDSRAWLQANCNCACTYNCTHCYNCFTYNCNCDCNCACK